MVVGRDAREGTVPVPFETAAPGCAWTSARALSPTLHLSPRLSRAPPLLMASNGASSGGPPLAGNINVALGKGELPTATLSHVVLETLTRLSFASPLTSWRTRGGVRAAPRRQHPAMARASPYAAKLKCASRNSPGAASCSAPPHVVRHGGRSRR